MNEKGHKRVANVEEARTKLLECFPGSIQDRSVFAGVEEQEVPRVYAGRCQCFSEH